MIFVGLGLNHLHDLAEEHETAFLFFLLAEVVETKFYDITGLLPVLLNCQSLNIVDGVIIFHFIRGKFLKIYFGLSEHSVEEMLDNSLKFDC